MAKILLKNGRVWDGEKFYFADVLTDGGRVVKIAEKICQDADFTMDAAGKTVSAGLIDMHTHLRGLSSDDIGAQAEMSSFPFGVTAVADAEGVRGDKSLLDSFLVETVVFAKVPIRNNEPDLDAALRKLQEYGDRAVGVKVFFDTGASEVRDAVPLQRISEFAGKNHLIVMVHSTNSPTSMSEIVRTLRKGDILTHVFHGGVHNASEESYKSLLEAKEKGVILDLGFEGFVHTDFQLFEDAVKAGIWPDVISTDLTKVSLNTRGGRYGLTLCMSAALKAGMSEEAIFRAVTSAPAKALGKEKEWGYLKEGACADIAVLERTKEGGFALTDMFGHSIRSEQGYQCVLTIADGQVAVCDSDSGKF